MLSLVIPSLSKERANISALELDSMDCGAFLDYAPSALHSE